MISIGSIRFQLKASQGLAALPTVLQQGRIMEMAVSTCAKCGGHSFERALLTPIGEDRKLAIVQCANCGTPIGALDSASNALIEGLLKQIASIDAGLVRIAKALSE
jgi:hypothetical protein